MHAVRAARARTYQIPKGGGVRSGVPEGGRRRESIGGREGGGQRASTVARSERSSRAYLPGRGVRVNPASSLHTSLLGHAVWLWAPQLASRQVSEREREWERHTNAKSPN